MAEHETCPCAAVEQLKELVEKHDERIARHEERLAKGDTDFALIHRDMTAMNESIKENTAVVKNLAEKPGKRWDSAVDRAIGVIITVVLTYIAVQLGLQ